MSKRNKIIISLAVSAFLIISLIVGLVVVFAEDQPIVRNVNVSFKVINSNCSVSAVYKYGDKETNTYLTENNFTTTGLTDADKVLTFENSNNFAEETLKPTSDIALTKENNSVIIEFKFENLGADNFDATLFVENQTASNVEVKFSQDGLTWKNSNVKINVTDDASYFVRISLIDIDADYSYSADFNWKILKTLA